MRILVIGGTGFLGVPLVRRFVAQLNRPARDPEGEGFVDLDRVA